MEEIVVDRVQDVDHVRRDLCGSEADHFVLRGQDSQKRIEDRVGQSRRRSLR